MPRKTPGNLSPPPPAEVFARLPLGRLCRKVGGVYQRLHSRNPETGELWPPVFFSQRGTSRFDPAEGVGTLCIADSLAGALLEMIGDQLEPVESPGRNLSPGLLAQWQVSLVSVPRSTVFETSGLNLSKLGVDLELMAGPHAVSRPWALRLGEHPALIDGIYHPSRHDDTRRNLALFRREHFLPAQPEPRLTPLAPDLADFAAREHGPLLYGPPIGLREHPQLYAALIELEVGLLPE